MYLLKHNFSLKYRKVPQYWYKGFTVLQLHTTDDALNLTIGHSDMLC